MDFLTLKSGTDIRGVATEGVDGEAINLTDDVIRRIAASFLIWCEHKLEKKSKSLRIAVGHDSRLSADRIQRCLIDIFVEYGCTAFNCGLASTPSMFMAVMDMPCDAAVQITASHHPYHRNGLKFFTADGGLDAQDIQAILVGAQENRTPVQTKLGEAVTCDFMKRYAEILRETIIEKLGGGKSDKPLDGFHIVVDAGNGAGGFYATDVLAPLGANVSGSVFLEPDGRFPNHIPNPEDAEAMRAVSKATVAAEADLGVIFDTDVDRGAVVDANGNEISRNRLVALASAIALEKNPGGTIVTDSITSDGLNAFIEDVLGGRHLRYKRGYKNVINEAIRQNETGINCPLAIETSGHAAMRENYFLDDGAYLVTQIIIKLAALRAEGRSLADLLAPLKEPLEEKELRFSILSPDFHEAGEQVISGLEVYAKARNWRIAPDNYEGIRISFSPSEGDGWMLLRLSVHDPIMPLNVESNKHGGVKQILTALKGYLDGVQGILDIAPLCVTLGLPNA